MEVYTDCLTFNMRKQYEMVHSTDHVEAIVRKSGVDDGLCFVSTKRVIVKVMGRDE